MQMMMVLKGLLPRNRFLPLYKLLVCNFSFGLRLGYWEYIYYSNIAYIYIYLYHNFREKLGLVLQLIDAALMDVYIPTFIDNNVEDVGPMASYMAEEVLKTIDLYEANDGSIQIDQVVKFILDNSSLGTQTY